MSDEIVVETGARLHLGLLALSHELPRQFGGAGLMVRGLGFRLRMRLVENDEIVGDDVLVHRTHKFLGAYRASATAALQPSASHLDIEPVP